MRALVSSSMPTPVSVTASSTLGPGVTEGWSVAYDSSSSTFRGIGTHVPHARMQHRREQNVLADETAEHLLDFGHEGVEIDHFRLHHLRRRATTPCWSSGWMNSKALRRESSHRPRTAPRRPTSRMRNVASRADDISRCLTIMWRPGNRDKAAWRDEHHDPKRRIRASLCGKNLRDLSGSTYRFKAGNLLHRTLR